MLCRVLRPLSSTLVAAAAWTAPPLLSALQKPSVLCVGEVLFDGLPSGIFLGGAPPNVACHLSQLGAHAGVATAVGRDRLGTEAVRRMRSRGVDVSLVAEVEGAETGFVTVEVDANGDASYEFLTPAAWDSIPLEGLESAAAAADAVVFGTLSQRASATRAAVAAACGAARCRVCDINLRPPFVDDDVVASAVCSADILKLNDEELAPVAAALARVASSDRASATASHAVAAAAAALEAAGAEADAEAAAATTAAAAAAIGDASQTPCVVVTRGGRGAVLWQREGGDEPEGRAWACNGYVAPSRDADTVGAGDAFLAAFLVQRLAGAPPDAQLEAGCRLGAFVAGAAGATPQHDAAQVAALQLRAQPQGEASQSVAVDDVLANVRGCAEECAVYELA